MIAISLQSGSSGNCTYIEAGSIKLLFDAGITGNQAQERLSAFGRDIRDIDALIISHDHSDHVQQAGVFQRKFGVPLYITPLTFEKALKRHRLGRLHNVNYFLAGGQLKFGDVTVESVPSPHDCADGAIFVVSSKEVRLGIMTDIGHLFKDLFPLVSSLDAVFIESNHDEEMLRNGKYPTFLKQRIRGPRGHLSNREAAELLLSGERLKWACLAHLSSNNNDPQTALRTHREILGNALSLYTASRHSPTEMLKVTE